MKPVQYTIEFDPASRARVYMNDNIPDLILDRVAIALPMDLKTAHTIEDSLFSELGFVNMNA